MWQRGTPEQWRLPDDEVHVWRAVTEPAHYEQTLLSLLSPAERERADRFHFQRDRRRFIVARGVLRTLVGQYLNLPPADVCFETNEYGKPYLAETMPHADTLAFNVSHAGRLVLYAFVCNRNIGVDVEHVRTIPEMAEIARRFFSTYEADVFHSLPPAEREEAFFACWTRKEAYIKARGKGLAIPLDQFDVSLIPGQPAQILRIRDAGDDASRWRLESLVPADRYVAAIAVEGYQWHLRRWQWAWSNCKCVSTPTQGRLP